jgi:hypothetical protein
MNLIANTGIHLVTIPLTIDANDGFKMFFHEWFDMADHELKLELAHFFAQDGVWVRKKELGELGYLNDGIVSEGWSVIKNDFQRYDKTPISDIENCFNLTIDKSYLDKFENEWLPLPFFRLNAAGFTEFGPVNWSRFKLVSAQNQPNNQAVKEYAMVIAFDTRTLYTAEDFETPFFANDYEKAKKYALCRDEFYLLDFCSKSSNCEWIDNYILQLVHPEASSIVNVTRMPRYRYLAGYIFLLNYIRQLKALPEITLFRDRNISPVNVDLSIDIGNSRTFAALFDNGDFTKVQQLCLQDFTELTDEDGKLNRHSEPFDMRLIFRKVNFGSFGIPGSKQFIFPGFVRLGVEANRLLHRTVNGNNGMERITSFSSPKRYLWDVRRQKAEWEFAQLPGEVAMPIWIDGISGWLNPDGSFNEKGEGGQTASYSRQSLMTFAFLEILAQSRMQINSYEYRHICDNEANIRQLRKIIITCPTAMSHLEQLALRRSAETACLLLEKFEEWQSNAAPQYALQPSITVTPSVTGIANRNEWTYDEATCSQFLFLYAETSCRYKNDVNAYFELYGKARKDLGNYKGKALTIGSVDIGAGTTDVMICSYKNENSLVPVPLFWDSFYLAGDDLVKEIIRQIIIEGPNALIYRRLIAIDRAAEAATLIFKYFGENHNNQTATDRRMRNDFNLQISLRIVGYLLELLRQNADSRDVTMEEIFSDNPPSVHITEHFSQSFGFDFMSQTLHYDKKLLTAIVEKTFSPLAGKISSVLAYCQCDFVLLLGRPSALKPVEDLFLRYYPVSPNRIVSLNSYRVGRWYPFQDGNGYFKNQKSIVATGAMIGNIASTMGSYNGFSLNLDILKSTLQPTTDYFGLATDVADEIETPFITPYINAASIEVQRLPVRLGARQWNSASYPARKLYKLDIDRDSIEQRIRELYPELNVNEIQTLTDNEIVRIKKAMPLKFRIVRDNFKEDRETLRIDSIEDREHNDLRIRDFILQIQSLSETDDCWLDTGEFNNLAINVH